MLLNPSYRDTPREKQEKQSKRERELEIERETERKKKEKGKKKNNKKQRKMRRRVASKKETEATRNTDFSVEMSGVGDKQCKATSTISSTTQTFLK